MDNETLLRRIEELERKLAAHTHNGYDSQFVSIENLQDFVPTIAIAPTHTPRSFLEQFRIFDDGVTPAFYWYDTTNHTWEHVDAA